TSPSLPRRRCLRGHDGAIENFAHFAIDVLRRNAHLSMRRGALEQRLRRLLIEHARVDGPIVQLTKREERCEYHAAIAAAERAVGKEREDERGDFFREGRIRLA